MSGKMCGNKSDPGICLDITRDSFRGSKIMGEAHETVFVEIGEKIVHVHGVRVESAEARMEFDTSAAGFEATFQFRNEFVLVIQRHAGQAPEPFRECLHCRASTRTRA